MCFYVVESSFPRRKETGKEDGELAHGIGSPLLIIKLKARGAGTNSGRREDTINK